MSYNFCAASKTETLKRGRVCDSKVNQPNYIMRTILLSTLGAIILLAAFSGCSTTVKTDNGHAVSAGVHTR
ncbi:MAG: hypothetical protein ABJB09_04730 [Verrucomicrobiota bacterium]